MQQTYFENILTKGEIAHNLFSMIKLSFIEVNHIFNKNFSKSSAADLSYVGKELTVSWVQTKCVTSAADCESEVERLQPHIRIEPGPEEDHGVESHAHHGQRPAPQNLAGRQVDGKQSEHDGDQLERDHGWLEIRSRASRSGPRYGWPADSSRGCHRASARPCCPD